MRAPLDALCAAGWKRKGLIGFGPSCTVAPSLDEPPSSGHEQRYLERTHPAMIFRKMHRAMGILIAAGSWLPGMASGQSLDDTVKFISDMTNTHGFVRALSCKNPKAPKPTKMTEIYATIPTGSKLGLIELNHGRDEVLTGFTQFDLHAIEKVDYRPKETEERGVTYHAVQFSCTGSTPCIVKTTFCTGAVNELETQLEVDSLLFRNASHAERVSKAFLHFLKLVHSEKNTSPF